MSDPKPIEDPLAKGFLKAIGDWLSDPAYDLIFKARPGSTGEPRRIDLFQLGIERFEKLRKSKIWPSGNS